MGSAKQEGVEKMRKEKCTDLIEVSFYKRIVGVVVHYYIH